MKLLIKNSKLTVLMMIATLVVGCSTAAKKDAGSTSDSMVDDATDAVALELNGSSDDNTAGGLKTIYFDFNSSQLSGAAKTTLEQNALWLKGAQNVSIQIEGHCDERGGVQYNLALGERRAKSVKDFLIAYGVTGARVSTISYGKENPTAYGHDDESWSKNRRANFKVTAK